MTATLTNPITEAIDALVAQPGVSDSDLVTALAEASRQVNEAARGLTAPLTHDQRRAMFAAFTDVFGDAPKPARAVFTRLVLGKAADAHVSWADDSSGRITAREASKVLAALEALEDAL